MNSLTLSTPYVSSHSYFSGDFKVNIHFVFADDFWSVVTQFSLTIPCVNDDSVFYIDFINRELVFAVDSIRRRDSIFKDDFSFYSDSGFADDLWITTGIVCLTIPCVKHESIFAITFMRRS
jgi:hypothetical protein